MATAIRGQASGSITERDGNLRVRVFFGRDVATGKKRERCVIVKGTSGRAHREANRIKNELLRQSGTAQRSVEEFRTDVNVGEVLDEWLRLGEQTKAPSTVKADRDNAKYLEPLRSTKVRLLGRKTVAAHYRELGLRGRHWVRGGRRTPKPLGPSTIANTNRTLQAALNAAVEWEWIPVNPIYRASKPRVGSKIRSVGDDEQWTAITSYFAGTEYEDYLFLALVTRMRRGELVALRWLDIEWELGRLLVRRAQSAGVIRDQTKTNVDRYIGLDDRALAVLRGRRGRCEKEAEAFGGQLVRNAYVFSDAVDGSVPWRAQRFTHAFDWARKQLAAEDPPIDLSNLRGADVTRHRGTTVLVRARRDPAVIAKENGHSLATLFKHYAHEFGQGDAGNAAILGDQFD